MNDFINDISKSRNRNFYSRKSWEGGYIVLPFKVATLEYGVGRNIQRDLTPWRTISIAGVFSSAFYRFHRIHLSVATSVCGHFCDLYWNKCLKKKIIWKIKKEIRFVIQYFTVVVFLLDNWILNLFQLPMGICRRC